MQMSLILGSGKGLCLDGCILIVSSARRHLIRTTRRKKTDRIISSKLAVV